MTAPIPPLHLYRALLRQTGKIFDPPTRDFFYKHVRDSFREHRHIPKLTTNPRPGLDSVQSRTIHQRKRARKCLNMLTRANNGHTNALTKMLEVAYGRRGVKRREEMQQYLVPDESSPKISAKEWKPPARFQQLMQSQIRVHHLLPVSGKIKKQPDVPERNRFGRPFPPVRVKGLYKNWLARTAKHLKPPMSEDMWRRAYDIAMGNTKLDLPHGQTTSKAVSFQPQTQHHNSEPARLVEQLSSMSSQRSSPHFSHQKKLSIGGPHKVTPRLIRRRIMHTVLQQTPRAIYDSRTQTTKYRWEIGSKSRRQPQQLSASATLSLFG